MTMETMQPTLKSGRYAWDRINMPVEEFQERVKKIRKVMKKEGIDLLLLYGNGFNDYGNYSYVSNTIARLPQGSMVALPLKGEVTLMFEGASRGVSSVKKMTWIDDVRASGNISKECIAYLKEKQLTSCVIGGVGLKRLMPSYQYRLLTDSLPGRKIGDSDRLLNELRMVKSRAEILQIRRTARIVSRVFDFITSTPFLESPENVLEAAARREARLEGAEDFRMMILKPSEKNEAFRPPEERIIRSGDWMIIYVAVEFERYWADAVRTFAFKESAFAEIQPGTVKTLYENILQGMKIRKRMSQFYRETRAKVAKARFEEILDYGMGQGIGLSLKELPLIAKEDRTLLADGICLFLRLGIRDKELGTIMVGDTIYLSKAGPEVVTR
jgi:Xaa-Pro aminopeptidase